MTHSDVLHVSIVRLMYINSRALAIKSIYIYIATLVTVLGREHETEIEEACTAQVVIVPPRHSRHRNATLCVYTYNGPRHAE